MGKYYKKKRSIHGRRKARPGQIVKEKATGRQYIVVGWKRTGSYGKYRCVPIDGRHRRFGAARWLPADQIENTGKRSKKASVQSYRANEWLTENMGRTCVCQCCIHVQYDNKDFSRATGQWINPK